MRVFRAQYLRRQNEAEHFDHQFPISGGALFIALLGVCFAFLASVCFWAVRSQLPIVVKSDAVIVPSGGVRDLFAIGDGIVETINFTSGDHVKPGQLLASLSDVGIERQYNEVREEYLIEVAAIGARESAQLDYFTQLTAQEAVRSNSIQNQIAQMSAERQRRESLMEELRIQTQEAVDRFAAVSDYIEETDSEITTSLNDLLSNTLIAPLDFMGKTVELSNRSLQMAESRLRASGFLFDLSEREDALQSVINALELEQQNLEALDLESNANLSAHRSELANLRREREAARTRLMLFERRSWLTQNVLSPYAGQILAMGVSNGQIVSGGSPIALVSLTPQFDNSTIVFSPKFYSGEIVFRNTANDERYLMEIPPSISAQELARLFAGMIETLFPQLYATVEVNGSIVSLNAQELGLQSLMSLRIESFDAVDSYGVPVFVLALNFDGERQTSRWLAVAFLKPRHATQSLFGREVTIRPTSENQIFGTSIQGRIATIGAFEPNIVDVTQVIGSRLLSERLLAGRNSGVLVTIDLSLELPQQLRDVSPGRSANAYIAIGQDAPYRILLPYLNNLLTGNLEDLT